VNIKIETIKAVWWNTSYFLVTLYKDRSTHW